MIIVLVPFYNFALKLIRCLEIIKNQDINNYKIILWDDGSDINEVKILRNWLLKEKKNNKFKYIYKRNKENMGVGFTKYYSLKYIQSNFDSEDIVIIIDGDDYLTRKDVFSNILSIYNDKSNYWTIGGMDGEEEAFQYEKIKIPNLNLRTLKIPPLRTFRKKVLDTYVFSNFFMGKTFINKTSDKVLMAPIIKNYSKNGVFIKQKIYEYERTELSLSHVKKIKKEDNKKYKIILQSRIHYLNNLIYCNNSSENNFYNDIKNKKILLVGNRPLIKDMSKIINNYDIVIRFNFSFNGNQDKNSGNKLDYLFINNGLCKHLLGEKYSKLCYFKDNTINEFKEWLNKNKNKIITRYYYSNQKEFDKLNNNYILLQSLLDTSLNDKLNFYSILDKYNLKFNKNIIENTIKNDKHFSLGMIMINWLVLRNIKCDICGFSKKTDNQYIISYGNLRKDNNSCVNLDKINNHEINLEWEIRNFYKINKLIRVIDE